MLDVFVKSLKPECGFKSIHEIVYSLDQLIDNLNRDKFRDSKGRDKTIDYILHMLEREKDGTDD